MTKRKFAEKVAEIVGGQVSDVEKANGITLTGITIGNGAVRPTIYIDQWYDEGIDINACATRVREVAERSEIPVPDLSYINDYSKIRSDLRLRLYHNSTHADIFQSASKYGFDDMILVPYLDDIIPNGSIKICTSLLEIWGVSREELFAEASKAGDFEILSMNTVLAELANSAGRRFDIDESCPMFIVTNHQRSYGAYGVIALAPKLQSMFPTGYTVIPSSVHECIVMPKNSADIEIINAMVKEVNTNCVNPEEVLGYRAYEF